MKQFYYKPIVTFDLLEKYHNGLICTSACIAGYISSKIANGKTEVAEKAVRKFKSIFGDDFYIEIQPYKISTPGLQEKVNEELIRIAQKYGIKMVLTSDSHFGREEDLDTYVKMHAIRGRDEQSTMAVYKERYMPKPNELKKRFMRMHGDLDNAEKLCKSMCKNLDEIVDKVDGDMLSTLPLSLPTFKGDSGEDSETLLKKNIKEGLKKRGKYNKKYWNRCMEEFDVIKEHGFHDYFLIVQDYVQWAKSQGISVGPGRGSVCNCEIAYALGITDVDSLYFGLDFRRFLRKDKKKLPDIDMDFETARRGEVIDYLLRKYKGKSIQICSYGLYKVDNLLNDLFKVCGVKEVEDQRAIKQYVNSKLEPETNNFDYGQVQFENKCKVINARFQNILKHFSKMYKKVKYIGTHAAGVAIVGTNIFDYTSVEKHGDKFSSAYDLNNLEKVNAIKFDMLGLRTMSLVKELQDLTGEVFTEEWLDDDEVYRRFREGDTEGVFQFERKAAADILAAIKADSIEDICAANALNRPGPLGLKMPEKFAYNKFHQDEIKKPVYWEQTKETYGTVVYQEQITAICREIGGLSWPDSDKVLKFMKGTQMTERSIREKEREEDRIRKLFIEGAEKNGISASDARDTFEKIVTYSFNKGHAMGYSLIAFEMMWYKVHYPMYFWYVSLKYAPHDTEEFKYKKKAIQEGILILTPHINGPARYGLRKLQGEECIQEGMTTIKGVGEKAALAIEEERKKNGNFKDIDDLVDRMPKRVVNSRVVKALKEAGACCFNKKQYYSNVVKYNTSIISR